MEFDAGKWHGRILFEPGNYHSLVSYVFNSNSLDAHFELEMSFNENGIARKFT